MGFSPPPSKAVVSGGLGTLETVNCKNNYTNLLPVLNIAYKREILLDYNLDALSKSLKGFA